MANVVWLDAHLSPGIARRLSAEFGIEAHALRELGLRDAEDEHIFTEARNAGAIFMTKDSDFVALLERFGPSPQILWLTCGNTSDAALAEILRKHFQTARSLFESGEPLVEIAGL
jgi:predicted nuclease of predicted toxin-antitoxin system